MQRSMIVIKRSLIAPERSSIVRERSSIILSVLTSAAMLTPATGWCAEGGGGEAAGGGSWLSLLLYIINFAIFVWILMRYAGPAARKFFADRAGGIRETFARAETTLKEAQNLANRAAERMSRLEAELKQLRTDLDAETEYIANRIREMARETALRIVRDSELTGNAIAEAAQRRVRAMLSENTARLARELMVRSFNDDDQARLLRGFEEKLAQEARR
jgi:F-type H+-transporting ATPase subunit b